MGREIESGALDPRMLSLPAEKRIMLCQSLC